MAGRFERMERTRVRLTKRDLQIVQAVFEARYLTNDMVCQLFFKPTTYSSCKQRMRILFDLGYVKKRSVHVNEPDVYFLGLKGRRYIASIDDEYGKAEVGRIAGVSGDKAGAPILMMNHDLTLSQLYVYATLECRQHGLEMEWKNTRMLELVKLGIEPDALLQVSHGDSRRAAFIEFTSVLPDRGEMKRRLVGFDAYLQSRRCQSDFGVDDIAVLWFTTSPTKADRIKTSLRDSSYPDYFLVGVIDDAERFVTDPIWHWSESEPPIRWVSPPTRE